MNGCAVSRLHRTFGGRQGDTIIFSLMTNNALASTSTLDAILDRIVALLASEN